MNLHELEAPAQNKKSRKRVGRGQGSGRGEQSGRGHNGQNSRSGSKVKRWFEGGQMPLQRRIPKFGFKNRFRTEYQSVNISQIQDYLESGRLSEKITLDDLISQGLANKGDLVKLLGSGEIKSKVDIEVHASSKSAKEKVEAAGGKITEIN
ncbi:MAG: 50S ribosomal protein L15 [Balneolaceae bacterium]